MNKVKVCKATRSLSGLGKARNDLRPHYRVKSGSALICWTIHHSSMKPTVGAPSTMHSTLELDKVKPIPTGRHLVETNSSRELSICLKEVKEATTCERGTEQTSNQPQQSVHLLRMCVSAQGLVATQMQS